jgi:hypothetical protein
MNNELGERRNKEVMGYVKVLYWHPPGRTVKSYV